MPRRLSKKVRRGKRLRKSKKLSGGAAAPTRAPAPHTRSFNLRKDIYFKLLGELVFQLKKTPLGTKISFIPYELYNDLFDKYIIAINDNSTLTHEQIVKNYEDARSTEILKITVSDTPLLGHSDEMRQYGDENLHFRNPKLKNFLILTLCCFSYHIILFY